MQTAGLFFPEEIYPSVSCKLNWWERLIKKKLVTSFSNMSQIFLAFVDHIWEFLALQAVCLFLPKELSQQSVFFDIAKQPFGIVFATLYWCKRLTRNKLVTNVCNSCFIKMSHIFLHLYTILGNFLLCRQLAYFSQRNWVSNQLFSAFQNKHLALFSLNFTGASASPKTNMWQIFVTVVFLTCDRFF